MKKVRTVVAGLAVFGVAACGGAESISAPEVDMAGPRYDGGGFMGSGGYTCDPSAGPCEAGTNGGTGFTAPVCDPAAPPTEGCEPDPGTEMGGGFLGSGG